jgi:transposase
MTPEETFRQLLGLGKAWRLVEARLEASSSTFILKVKETAALWPEESTRAGPPVTCHDHVEPMQWRHLNVFNKECVIVCGLSRGRGADDARVYCRTPPLEGRKKRFTPELKAFAATLMREMPGKAGRPDSRRERLADVADALGHVKAAHTRVRVEDLVYFRADDINRLKGHNYLTVFANLIPGRVHFATPGKKVSVWEGFAAQLRRHDGHPKAIKHVTKDMSVAHVGV